MKRWITTAFSLLFISTFTFAQEKSTMELTLAQSIQYALQNHTSIKNADLDVKSMVAKNKEITSIALPQVNATGGINYAPLVAAFQLPNFIKGSIGQFVNQNAINQPAFNDPSTDYIALAFQPKWTTTATIELRQILFDPGVLIALQARNSSIALSELAKSRTENQIKVNVTKAYYNILVMDMRQDLLAANIEKLLKTKIETNEIYEAGLAEKLDVDRITVALNNLQNEKVKIDQLMNLAYMMFKYQMGMPLEQDVVLLDKLTDEKMRLDLLTEPLNFNRKVEYQLTQKQQELNAFNVKRYKTAWIPTLSAFGNYGYTLYNGDKLFQSGEGWQKSALIGVQLNVPIFSGFQRTNQLKQAQFEYERGQNNLDQLKQSLELQKESARITYQSNLTSLSTQKENMALAEEVYRVASIKYKEGVGSSLEVLTAETAAKEAQVNYFNSLYETINAMVDLADALGEL